MDESLISELKKEWTGLLDGGQELVFQPGQVLFYEGHQPCGLFVLKAGKVEFTEGPVPCKSPHIIAMPKGRAIGGGSFFKDTPYCCSCTATTICRVTFISKGQLLPFFQGTH